VRFTIERIRTLVLAAGFLVLVAMGVFLVHAKWKNLRGTRDLPHRLERNIQQEAKEFSFVHAYGAHSQFRIHASREVQLRDNRVQLHDVQIELYGEDGNSVDKITGDTFDYDQKSGLAIAEGPVEMVLTRPVAAPTSSGKAATTANSSKQIHLETSGLTFDQDSGMVATAKRVDFTMAQGSGSAVGAMFDSQKGYLTLDHAVELTMYRGAEAFKIGAQHAECDRDAQVCSLRGAKMNYRGGEATAIDAKIQFRADGTAEQLDATDGFAAETATGGHLSAPTAEMNFNEKNQPEQGHLEGGVTMDSGNGEQSMHGSAPAAEFLFTAQGLLRQARFDRGAIFDSKQTTQTSVSEAEALQLKRTWRSPQAEVNFRDAGEGRLELESVHGTGGVNVTSETQRGTEPVIPAKMSADQVTGTFAPGSALESLTGIGHASLDETSATGTRETAFGDRLVASFAPPQATQERDQEGRELGDEGTREQEKQGTREQRNRGGTQKEGRMAANDGGAAKSAIDAATVQSAELDGHVVLFEQPAARPGLQPPPQIHAAAGKAEYEQTGHWVHLTINPRAEYDGLDVTAEKMDLSQQSGDAFAHGNVKATWSNMSAAGSGGSDATAREDQGTGSLSFGDKGAAHVISEDADLNQSTGEATFRGHARLWQMANSISAPVIVLNQHAQTLVARASQASDPVRVTLLSAGGPTAGLAKNTTTGQRAAKDSSAGSAPELIRVRGGDLWYSQAEERALMHGGALGAVVAETATAKSFSDEVDLRLMPAAKQEGGSSGQTEVDRLTAAGHVVLSSHDRRGTGEQLAYSSVTGQYVLTGTEAAPPKLTAPGRGTVSGEALIFNSGNDSVSIEGGGRETMTETTAPDVRVK
jgi:lipopolysaccharide export system protein LptA